MSPFAITAATTLALVVACMLVLWAVSLRLRDAGIVDPFWGAGFVVVAITAWAMNSASPRGGLLVALVAAWGSRLSLFLLRRNWGKPEDHRYAAMREKHGERFAWVSLATVFGLQAAILWFVSFPVQAAIVASSASDAAPLGWLDAFGLALWAIGFYFEAVGDWQLARFKADPANRGRVMDRGLWRYTRHPNYFGDFCVWWGLYAIAAAAGEWWTVASPLLMSFLLMRVSGVTLLESTIVERRPDYAAYQRRTSAFFPWPPRRD